MIKRPLNFKKSLTHELTLRYGIALLLVAILMFCAYFTLVAQIQSNDKNGHIINISGMQRMLSQRILLLSLQISYSNNTDEADILAQNLAKARDRMRSNHDELISSYKAIVHDKGLESRIHDMYFDENGIDSNINRYLAYANDYLNTYKNAGLASAQKTSAVSDMEAMIGNGFLIDLNTVVFWYQKHHEARVRSFQNLELFFLCLGLLVLLFEVFFIFRPMVKKVVSKTKELEVSNKELTEFSYRVSHDLRAPIVSSYGLANIAKKEIEKENFQTATKAIEHISDSMNRLEKLIDDILNFTKFKMLDAEKEEVDVSELVEHILDNLASMPGFERVEIRRSNSLSRSIMTKRVVLQQILGNLISNAIKYSDTEKAKSFVMIDFDENESHYIFSIKDNGIGIPEEYRDKIFGMFQRFHPKLAFGSGLGLYLVHEQAQVLNGSIEYIPLEEGTEFKLIILKI